MSLEVSIDLEYIGCHLDPVVISIGACVFDRHGDGVGTMPHYILKELGEGWDFVAMPTFYEIISIDDSLSYGMNINQNTLNWWVTDQAKNWPDQRNAITVNEALQKFQYWYFNACNGPKSINVWGHGKLYDLAPLVTMCHKLNMLVPWGHPKFDHNTRDTRTLFDAAGYEHKSLDTHNALEDAIHQAKGIQTAFRLLRDRYIG